MLQVDISSSVRSVFGKGPMRQLRKQNFTPANLYGGGKEAMPLQFESAELFKKLLFIQGRNAVVNLEIEGDEQERRHVLVREIQKEPATGGLLHVDFQEIDLDKPRIFKVPLKYTGKAKGVELGGELEIYKNEITLKGSPLNIPEAVEVNLTPLEKGGAPLTYGDIQLADEIKMLEKPKAICASVI